MDKAFEVVKQQKYHAPRSSMLVNGYSKIHQDFEQDMASIHGFEACISVGSGFLANMALIESLVRGNDVLLIDEEFHASGILATKLLQQAYTFAHNNCEDLESKLSKYAKEDKSIVIAIEGIYSMSGDVCPKEIFDLALKYDALLIVDEAHSSGVMGNKCLGVMDFYNITPCANFIKMGTLGKAFGSYGAYILASRHIVEFLENRAKSIIYSTAPSLFDIALAHQALLHIQQNCSRIQQQIKAFQQIMQDNLGITKQGLIFPIVIGDNEKVMQIQADLKDHNLLIGAIREPTVSRAILRIIGNLNYIDYAKSMCTLIGSAVPHRHLP